MEMCSLKQNKTNYISNAEHKTSLMKFLEYNNRRKFFELFSSRPPTDISGQTHGNILTDKREEFTFFSKWVSKLL